jgi:large subunit ribosomal protein L3
VVRAVTVLDAPPLYVWGVRLYTLDPTTGYKRSVAEVWAQELPKYLSRVLTLPEKVDFEKQLKKVEEYRDVTVEVRALVATQPHLSGIGKKTPEILEIPIGGVPSIDERINYALSLLGKTVSPKDAFTPGQLVDVIAITKGKGYQGVVRGSASLYCRVGISTERVTDAPAPSAPRHLRLCSPSRDQARWGSTSALSTTRGFSRSAKTAPR